MTQSHVNGPVAMDPVLSAMLKRMSEEKVLNTVVTPSSLKELGERLEIRSEDRVRNNGFVFALTDAIQQELSVARFYVSGSYGRRASLGSVEIDLVVFLMSKELPPYDAEQNNLIRRLHEFLVQQQASLSKRCGHRLHVGSLSNCKVSKPEATTTSPPYIRVTVHDTAIRIFLAPSLGRTSEEQRQATYKCMQTVYNTGGLEAVAAWHPSLIERPSEVMASAHPRILSFIRVCCLWARCVGAPSLRMYAVETLAYLIARKIVSEQQQQQHPHKGFSGTTCVDLSMSEAFDCEEGFTRFLMACADLERVASLCDIESPASYVSPWTHYRGPVLTDNFNPYDNLLESLTLADAQRIENAAQAALEKLERKAKVTLLELFCPNHSTWTTTNRVSWFMVQYIGLLVCLMVAVVAVYIGILFRRAHWDFNTVKTEYRSLAFQDLGQLRVWTHQLQAVFVSLYFWIKETLPLRLITLYKSVMPQRAGAH